MDNSIGPWWFIRNITDVSTRCSSLLQGERPTLFQKETLPTSAKFLSEIKLVLREPLIVYARANKNPLNIRIWHPEVSMRARKESAQESERRSCLNGIHVGLASEN